MTLRVGFVGLGAVGKPMALCVVRGGFPLTVFDIRPEPLAELAAAGAEIAVSARDAAERSDIFVMMVLNHAQAEQVLAGEGGALAALGPGKTVIVTSTISPSQSRHLAGLVQATGAAYAESPISGGYLRAADGTLSLMVSGPEATQAHCMPVLQAMGKYIYNAGPEPGQGMALKMINQMLMSIHELAASEAMVLATKSGIAPELVYDLVSHGTGDSWAFRNRMDRLMARDFTCKGALEILHKDLGIVLAAAQETRTPLLLTPVTYQAYQAAMVAGLAREDDTAVAKILEQLAGVEVRGSLTT